MAGDEAEPQDGHQGDEGAHPDPGKDTAASEMASRLPLTGPSSSPTRPGTRSPMLSAARSGESADQFYRTWRQTVASGHATSVSGGDFRDLNVGNTTIYSYARSSHQPGPIRAEILDDLAGRYTRVEGYEALLEQLRSRKLIALHSTREPAAPQPRSASWRTPQARQYPASGLKLTCIPCRTPNYREAGAARRTGLSCRRDRGTGGGEADRACKTVADGAFLHGAAVAPAQLRWQNSLGDYVVDCPLPDPRTVLDLAIDHEIARRPDLEQALQDLDVTSRLAESGARLPSEVVWLVTLLLSHASGDISSDQLTRMSGDSLSRYVSDWFDPLAAIPASAAADDQVRLATFRIALAVFNQTPFDLVAEAGERLAQQILTAGSTPATGQDGIRQPPGRLCR